MIGVRKVLQEHKSKNSCKQKQYESMENMTESDEEQKASHKSC